MRARAAVWGGGVVAAITTAVLAFACGASDGFGESDGGADASEFKGTACVFNVRTVFACPNEPDQPGPWQTECIDSNDCSGLAPTTQQSQGCTGTSQIEDAVKVTGTCAQIAASSTTTTTEAGVVVLDAGAAAVPCAPGDAASFVPVWHPPRPKQSACSAALIQSFIQCIDDSETNADPSSCQPWADPPDGGANATCLSCLESSPGDSQWGPLLILPNETLLNVAGCMALAEGDTTGTQCGGLFQADEECDLAACAAACPIGSSNPTIASQEIALETACETMANSYDGGTCAASALRAQCVARILDGEGGTPEEQACLGLPSGSDDAVLQAVATEFCGQ